MDETTQTPPAAPEAAAEQTSEQSSSSEQDWLASASVEEIRRHPRFQGILDSTLEQERARIREQIAAQQAEESRQKAEQELLRLANDDPYEFSRRYLSEAEQKRLAKNLDDLRRSTRTEYAQKLGQAYSSLPEWREFSPEEQAKIAQQLAGKSDDEVLGAFATAAVDVLAERRAQKRLADWREKELVKEREAIRQEEAAKKLQGSPRPDLSRGTQGGKFDPSQLSDAEFNKWYQDNILSRR